MHIDVPEWQMSMIEREAAKLAIPRTHWIRALIAHRLRSTPCFSRDAELALFSVYAEARAMRTELAQLRRLLQTGATPGVSDLTARLDRIDEVLALHRTAIRAGFEGNLRYWAGEP